MTSPSPAASNGGGELLVGVADAVATVTFSNPGKRNALTGEMRANLPGLLDALQADPDVRVVVLTGAGDKAFVSGADISEFGDLRTSPAARAGYDRAQAVINRSWTGLDKPVIAMIRGLLPGRGPAHRAAGGHPHRRRRQPVRDPGRPARARLRPGGRDGADQPGRAGRHGGDPAVRPPLPGGGGSPDGPGQPGRRGLPICGTRR